jgi:TolA-binding protein
MRKIGFFAILAFFCVIVASCAFRSSKHSFGPYSDAENFYKGGNYSKAIEKYQEYLSVYPQGNLAAIAEYYIAKSQLASGNESQAHESFERVIKRYPGTSWADFAKEQLGISGEKTKPSTGE